MIWLGIGLGFGARDLPRADARRRQRAAWVLGRAWEVEFCDHAERAGPAWLTPEDIEQVKRHAASLGIKCEPLREASGRYSRPVDLPRRLVTRARQLEHELTVALRAGDAGVAEVVERWTDSELGWTDRLAEVLREPSEPGEAGEVALAMTLACEYNVQGVRSELAVRQGASGPDWIRQLARLASASLETQAGDRVTAWPDEMERLVVGLEGEAAAVVRMLAAGGPAMIDAFERATGAGSNATFALIEAARAEARRRRQP
jgi:hypothetical protein